MLSSLDATETVVAVPFTAPPSEPAFQVRRHKAVTVTVGPGEMKAALVAYVEWSYIPVFKAGSGTPQFRDSPTQAHVWAEIGGGTAFSPKKRLVHFLAALVSSR